MTSNVIREKELKAELRRLIGQLKALDVKKIILFGSLATGHISLGSDIDLIALFEDDDNFKNRMRRVYQYIDAREGVDILAYNFAEFDRLKDRPFFKYIQSQGEVIYERP